MDQFDKLLQGAAAMDQHFRTAPLLQNMPVIMAMLGIWYNNLLGAHSQAIIPYAQGLALLPAYLQQTEMESNGKRVSRQGDVISYPTAPVIWGGVGTNSQHAFFQMLHQGTQLVPIDFIALLESQYPLGLPHKILLANCLAQSEALMRGKTREEVAKECPAELVPHKVCPGNQPSNTVLLRKLSPESLGALIALYEHKIFVQSILWNVNAFDQWGVELGKQLAQTILADFSGAFSQHDSSTTQLIAKFKETLV
jgi:glucose-6-phosphate isomerase